MSNRALLQKKIDEYEIVEKYFKTDSKGEIIYDEKRNQEMTMKNFEANKEYMGYQDFMSWVGNKTKKQLLQELICPDDTISINSGNTSNFMDDNDAEIVINPSDEQKAIINCVSEGKNVMVDAVAGSGKTTTVMFIAKQNPGKKILQITYNKQLKLEVRKKVEVAGIKNLDIHTFHSLAVRFYDKDCHTDDKIIKILSGNNAPKLIKKYDIIIVDELQDMTPNYFSLVCKFMHDMQLIDSNILVLGDRYQGVYDFKNADTRFLVHFDKIWHDNASFVNLPMRESYRVTKQIAWFVNNVMLGYERIISKKEGHHKVYYYRKSKFKSHGIFAAKIVELLKEGYTPADIFILAPSLKSTSARNPLKLLENKLVGMNIPVYFSRNEEEGLDEDIIKGKIAFTTFHQSKGRERKVCLVYGFDNSYFKYYNKNKDSGICPSELYVATTRASEVLIVIESDDELQLDFMNMTHQELAGNRMVQFLGIPPKNLKDKEQPMGEIHKTSVTELTSYISEENNEKLMELLDKVFEVEKKPSDKKTVDIPLNIVTNNGKTEDVSDINGLVIPSMFEFKRNNVCTLKNIIGGMYKKSNKETKELINSVLNTKVSKDATEQFLCMGNLYIALREKIHSKLNQIDNYTWLTQDMIDICHKNLKKNITGECQFEVCIGNSVNSQGDICFIYSTNLYGVVEVTSRVDCIDDNTIWEFKCVSTLQNEHLLQLLVYAWIWENTTDTPKEFKIINIRTGEVRKLIYKAYYVEEAMSILFSNKYSKRPKDEDEVFINKCNNIREKIGKNENKPLARSMFEFKNELIDDDDNENDDAALSKNLFFSAKKKEPKPEKEVKVKSEKEVKVKKVKKNKDKTEEKNRASKKDKK
jgi:hypothetical protein